MPTRNASLVQGNRLKLGLFGSNCSSGRSYTTIPERWVASWENNLRLARMADEIGIEAMIPIARWKGYGGETNVNGSSLESTTWATGLLAHTRDLNVFATIHVPLHHPTIVAKQIATADHVGEGRFGLNIVCGWNEDEFQMFGVAMKEHDDRYVEGREWWEIVTRIWSGEGPFDYDGIYYQLRGLEGAPAPYANKAPMIMNAGASPAGREFAIRYSDMHFDSVGTPEATIDRIKDTKARARDLGRDIQVWTPVGIICRPTRREADEFFEYCVEHMDKGAVGPITYQLAGGSSGQAPSSDAKGRHPIEWMAVARGSYCTIGTPDEVATEMTNLHEMGLDGLAINFVDYIAELPYFTQEVLPRLERAGVRNRVASVART